MCEIKFLLDTARAGADYVANSATLDFATSSTNNSQHCTAVTVSDDSVFEGDETFDVILTTETPRVMLENDMSVVTITDNEGQCC